MKILKGFLIAFAVLGAIYFIGPTPKSPVYDKSMPQVPSNLIELENHIKESESTFTIKPDNEARIIWTRRLPLQPLAWRPAVRTAPRRDPAQRASRGKARRCGGA